MINFAKIKPTLKAWIIGVATLTASGAYAQLPDASTQVNLDFLVVNEGLPQVIQYVFAQSDLRAQMSDSVQGRLRARQLTGTPAEILTDLAADHDLDWFVFNGTHYIDVQRNSKTRIVPLGALTFDRVITALQQADIPIQQYSVSSAAEGSALVLSGPPKLLGIVEALVASTSADVDEVPKIRVRRANEIVARAEQ